VDGDAGSPADQARGSEQPVSLRVEGELLASRGLVGDALGDGADLLLTGLDDLAVGVLGGVGHEDAVEGAPGILADGVRQGGVNALDLVASVVVGLLARPLPRLALLLGVSDVGVPDVGILGRLDQGGLELLVVGLASVDAQLVVQARLEVFEGGVAVG
jgi:hypothetical protein